MKTQDRILFLILMLGLLCHINVYADEGHDYGIAPTATIDPIKKWVFGDEEFDSMPARLEGDVSFGDLVLHKNICFRNLTKDIKNKAYTRCMDIKQSSTTDKSYISISLDGPSNVYFIAQTNAKGNPRDLKITNTNTSQTSYLTVNEAGGYCYRYRDTKGTIEVRSNEDTIRVYAIMVEAYDSKKYDYLNNYPNRLWDLSQITEDETLTENKDFDGLTVFKGVNLLKNVPPNKYGFKYYSAIDLEREGTDENNSIAFDVQKDTDIYITARSTSSQIKQLIITDRYGCNIETENNIQAFDVTNDADTYKLSYKGEDTTLYAYSDSGAIRIYQVAAIKQSDKSADIIDCDFSNRTDIAVGQNMSGRTLEGIRFTNGTVVEGTDGDHSKAIRLNGHKFALADKMSFDISAGSKKTITVSAKETTEYASMLVVANQYGYIVGAYDLSTQVQEYEFEYTGAFDTLYLYATASSVEVYSISTIKKEAPPTYNVSVRKGSQYRYSFTVQNAPVNNAYTYIIEYDPSKLKIVHIGKDNNFTGGLTDNSIENVVNTSGKITFNIAENTINNWSGIATSVLFEGVSDGNTSIKFSAERR